MSDSGPKMWKTVDIKFDGHTKVLFLWESRSDLAPYWPRKNWSAHKIKRSFKSETIRLFLSELASGNGRDTSHSVWINPETADVANESWTLEHRVFLLFGWWFYSRFVERQFWRVSEPIQFRISSRVLFWNVRADLWFEWMIPWLKKSAVLIIDVRIDWTDSGSNYSSPNTFRSKTSCSLRIQRNQPRSPLTFENLRVDNVVSLAIR